MDEKSESEAVARKMRTRHGTGARWISGGGDHRWNAHGRAGRRAPDRWAAPLVEFLGKLARRFQAEADEAEGRTTTH